MLPALCRGELTCYTRALAQTC